MAKKTPNFGGKKAAPFAKGGGRKKASTKTAKGTKKSKGNARALMAPAAVGASPTTAIGGGRFKSKGKVRKSANAAPTMGGQAGMTTARQAN